MASFNIPKPGPPPAIGTYQDPVFSPPSADTDVRLGPDQAAQGWLGDIGAGFQIGGIQALDMSGQLVRGLGSGLLRGLGAGDLADTWDLYSFQASRRTGRSIAQLEGDVDLPTRVNDVDSVGSFLQWSMYALAKQAPQLMTQFGLAAIGGALGGPGLAYASFLGTSYILGAGEVYSSALAEAGEHHLGASLAAGIPIALLDFAPWSRTLRRMGKGADYGSFLSRKLASGKGGKAFVSAMETGVYEGNTEAAQNLIEQWTVEYVQDRNISLAEMMADPEFKESAATGAVVGFTLGGFITLMSGGRGTPPPILPPPDPEGKDSTTVEAELALGPLHGEPLPAYKLTTAQKRTQKEAEALVGPEAAEKRTLRRYEPVSAATEPIATERRPGFAVEEEGPMPVWLQRQRLLPITRPKGETVQPRTRLPEGAERPVVGLLEGVVDPTRLTALDEVYLEQTALVDKLNKDLRKAAMEGPVAENAARDRLDVERLKLDVMALESAVQDRVEGGEGVTPDGQTIPQIQESIRRARPRQVFVGEEQAEELSVEEQQLAMLIGQPGRMEHADAELGGLHERVQAAMEAGASPREIKRIIGEYSEGVEQQRVARDEEREQAEEAEASREEEARVAPLREQLTIALGELDLVSKGAKGRLLDKLKEIGITGKELGIDRGFGAKQAEIIRAAYDYVGVEETEAAAVEEDVDISLEAAKKEEAERQGAEVLADEREAIEEGKARELAAQEAREKAAVEKEQVEIEGVAKEWAEQKAMPPPDQTVFNLFHLLKDWGLPFLETVEGLPSGEGMLKGQFFGAQYLTNPFEVTPEPAPMPTEETQLWHDKLYLGSTEVSQNKYINQIVAFINGKAGKNVKPAPWGLRAINEQIRKANEKRQKNVPELTLVDVSNPDILEWDSQGRTSKQLIDDLKKYIKAVAQEPAEIKAVKKSIHERLIKKAEEEAGKPLTDAQKSDLTPIYVSLSGRYVLKPKKVEIKEGDFETAGWALDKVVAPFITETVDLPSGLTVPRTLKDRPITARKTATQQTGLMLAYDEKDQLLGVQEFDLNLSKLIAADLDYLRAKYNVTPRSPTNNWALATKKEIVDIYLRYNLPMKGYISIETQGKTETVSMSNENIGYVTDKIAAGANIYYRDVPAHQLTFGGSKIGFGAPPELTKVWVGRKERAFKGNLATLKKEQRDKKLKAFEKEIPEPLRKFMKRDKELGGYVLKQRTTLTAQGLGITGNERAFAEAFETLSVKEQQAFKEKWVHQSPDVNITLKSKQELSGRITGYLPSVYEIDESAKQLELDFEQTLGEYPGWNKVQTEEIEFTDYEGNVHYFSKDDVVVMDNAAAALLDPMLTPMSNADLVSGIENNIIHGRERDSSFLQRMSDPEIRVAYGVNYYIQPRTIEVGSKVYVRSHLDLPVGPTRVGVTKWTLESMRDIAPELVREKGATSHTVRSIEDGVITLDGLPGRGFKAEELIPSKFPVRDRLVPYTRRGRAEEEMLTVGEIWELKQTELKRREIIEGPFADEITWDESGTYILSVEEKKTIIRKEKSLSPGDVQVGGAVRLVGSIVTREQNQLTGKVTAILADREGLKPITILKEDFIPQPKQEFIISKKLAGFKYVLQDPRTGEDVIETTLSNISRRSYNSKDVLANIAKIKRGLDDPAKAAKVAEEAQEPWSMKAVPVAPFPGSWKVGRVPPGYPRKEVPEVEETARLDVKQIEAGLYRITIGDRVFKVERSISYAETEKGKVVKHKGQEEWQVYSLKTGLDETQMDIDPDAQIYNDDNWLWNDTVFGLKGAKELLIQEAYAAGVTSEQLIKAFSGQFRVAPTNRWTNLYGVSIEEFTTKDGTTYFEVYLPETYNQFQISERFAQRSTDEGPGQALQRAMDKYGGSEFYGGQPVATWLIGQRRIMEEVGVRIPPRQALSWTLAGLTLSKGAQFHINMVRLGQGRAKQMREERGEGRVKEWTGGRRIIKVSKKGEASIEWEKIEIMETIFPSQQFMARPGMLRLTGGQLIEKEIVYKVRRAERDEKGELINGEIFEVPASQVQAYFEPISSTRAANNVFADVGEVDIETRDADLAEEARLAEAGEYVEEVDGQQEDMSEQEHKARVDSDIGFDESNTEPFFSLYFDENETTDGGFPQRLIGSEREGGTTPEELFNILGSSFGEGIFNIVKIVRNQGELPPNINTDSPIRAVAYNHRVWLVADRIPAHRVVPILMHEIGAHGIRAIVGDKAYMSLLGTIAKLAVSDAGVRRAYNIAKAAVLKTHPDANEWIILEETMAYYAESNTPVRNTFWTNLFHYVLQGLHRLKLMYTDELKGWQVMVLIRASFNAHRDAMNGSYGKTNVYTANFLDMPLYQTDEEWGEVLHDPRMEAMENILPISPIPDWVLEKVPMGKGLGKIFKVNYGPKSLKKSDQISFSSLWLGKRQPGRERFYLTPGVELHTALFDYFAVIKGYQEAVEARGGKVTESPYRTHGEYKNIVNERRLNFWIEYVEPLQDFSKKHKIDTNDLHWYLYAMHAPARNASKLGWKKKEGMPPSGMWDNIEEAESEANIYNLESAEGVKLKLQEKLSSEQYARLEDAAQYIYRINDVRLNMWRDEGLIPEWKIKMFMGLPYVDDKGKSHGANEKRQKFAATYVPLRGDKIDSTWDIFAQTFPTSGLGIKGAEVKKMLGRHSAAESTWAWSIQQVNDTIDRAEKNKVDQSFARFIWENRELLKDQMVVIHDQDFKLDRDPEGALFLGLHPKSQADPNHVISFKQNGEQWHILVKDRRIGRAFNRTRVINPNWVLNLFARANRWFALVNTTLSPEFILTNFSRDYQTALFNLVHETATRKGLSPDMAKKMAKEVTRNAWKATKGMHKFVSKRESDTEWSALAKEFSEAGGRINFYGFKDVNQVQNMVQDMISDGSRNGWRKFLKMAGFGKKGPGTKVAGVVSDVNSAVENTMRLSTYASVKKQLMANGMTESEAIREAADVARNLTVNFTMKGELTPVFNALYLFFNAGTAGSARAIMSYAKSRKVRQIAKAGAAFTIANSFANYMVDFDDDEKRNRYAQIPMDQRSRQIYIYVPGADDWIKIPLAYGFNIPFVMGDTLVALGMGQINPAQAATHLIGSIVESFFPLDVANSDRFLTQVFKTASPTITDIAVDLASNENWAGNPIFKEPYPGSMAEPPAYRAWASTSEPSKFIADWMNRLTSGSGSKFEKGFVSVDPTILDYFWNIATGSMGRFLKNSGDIGWDFVTKGKIVPRHRGVEDIYWSKVPIARRFMHDEFITEKWDINTKYTAYREEVGESKYFAKGIFMEFGVESKEWKTFKKSYHYDLVKLDKLRSKIEGAITKLYKVRKSLRTNRLMREDLKKQHIIEVEKKILELKRRFVRIFDEKIGRGLRMKSLRKAA